MGPDQPRYVGSPVSREAPIAGGTVPAGDSTEGRATGEQQSPPPDDQRAAPVGGPLSEAGHETHATAADMVATALVMRGDPREAIEERMREVGFAEEQIAAALERHHPDSRA